jgi:hypothetical protein
VALEVTISNSGQSRQILVERDGQEIKRISCSGDSLFYDENLLPNQSYSYKSFLLDQGKKVYGTEDINITTMDTTSHDFEWQAFSFGGQGGSSTFYDVAIINENDIWAVGEIYTEETSQYDSLGNWIEPYNAVHWNGQSWELERIYVEYRGIPTWAPLEGIFSFNSDEVVFSSGLPYLPLENHWRIYHLWEMGILENDDGGVNRVWGISLAKLYFVGKLGTIVSYNSNIWLEIESEIDLPIKNIWGSKNNRSGQYEVLCVASSPFEKIGKKILQIENYTVKTLSDSGISDWVSSVWFSAGRIYYVAGSGIYEKHRLSDKKWQNVSQEISNYYIHSIRGNDVNDIVAVGGYGEILHFDGSQWKSFYDQTQLGYGNYYAVDIKDNITIAVGSNLGQAVIIIGRRH